jgi:hypothetical protein
MRRALALQYANEVARRLHSVNGILATPMCDSDAVRFKRVWVFGSTVKGSQAPNDLDLLIEAEPCGRHYSWKQAKMDKWQLRQYGFRLPVRSTWEAFKWLTKGMRKVSRHSYRYEGDIGYKVLIYPRNDLLDIT